MQYSVDEAQESDGRVSPAKAQRGRHGEDPSVVDGREAGGSRGKAIVRDPPTVDGSGPESHSNATVFSVPLFEFKEGFF